VRHRCDNCNFVGVGARHIGMETGSVVTGTSVSETGKRVTVIRGDAIQGGAYSFKCVAHANECVLRVIEVVALAAEVRDSSL
jgi:hypothetical protein